MHHSATLILHTCDDYEFCWDSFIYYFGKHVDCTFPKFFCTEEKFTTYEGFDSMCVGKGEWSDRLIRILEAVESEFVFYIQEDIWARAPINLDSIPGLVAAGDLHCLHVQANCGYYDYSSRVAGINIFSPTSKYLLNHKPALWRRDFLLSCLEPGENPWENEVRGTKRLQDRGGCRIGLLEERWYYDVCRKGTLNKDGVKLKC